MTTTRGSLPGVDPAVAAARAVVGLYGDPRVSWAIGLELTLVQAIDPDLLTRRASDVVARHPHLGRAPSAHVVELVEPLDLAADWELTRNRVLDEPFGDREPLVRIVVSHDHRRLLVAGHHGALDGLGLIGLVGLLLDVPLGTSARGVARTGTEPGFVRGNLGRLFEAAVAPPTRFAASTRTREPGDLTALALAPAVRLGTAALSAAVLGALRDWNSPVTSPHPVLALGVSRRPGVAPIEPTRDTAYSRLVLAAGDDSETVSARLARTLPEPDFPARTRPGLTPMVTRALASRLGSTALVSNLGRLEGADEVVETAALWPAAAGPHGVAVGLVSAPAGALVSTRLRRRWFTDGDAHRLAAAICRHLASGGPTTPDGTLARG